MDPLAQKNQVPELWATTARIRFPVGSLANTGMVYMVLPWRPKSLYCQARDLLLSCKRRVNPYSLIWEGSSLFLDK